MSNKQEILNDVVIKFAGDSGDGMQLTGSQFTNNTAMLGIDLATFPDFPAEIRAPIGTLPGVSGYQLRFSSDRVFTPGDACDVLVAMNAAALKTNLIGLKPGGRIIANEDGFDAKNLRLANYPEGVNPLEDESLSNYEVIRMDVTKMTREALKDRPTARTVRVRARRPDNLARPTPARHATFPAPRTSSTMPTSKRRRSRRPRPRRYPN